MQHHRRVDPVMFLLLVPGWWNGNKHCNFLIFLIFLVVSQSEYHIYYGRQWDNWLQYCDRTFSSPGTQTEVARSCIRFFYSHCVTFAAWKYWKKIYICAVSLPRRTATRVVNYVRYILVANSPATHAYSPRKSLGFIRLTVAHLSPSRSSEYQICVVFALHMSLVLRCQPSVDSGNYA